MQSKGQVDIFAVKLGPDGSHVWGKGFGDPNVPIGNPNPQSGAAIAADPEGNVLVTGSLSGVVDFGEGLIGGNAIVSDIFVVKLKPEGSPRLEQELRRQQHSERRRHRGR